MHGKRKDRCECQGAIKLRREPVVFVRNASTQTEPEAEESVEECAACAGKHRRHTCGRKLWKRKKTGVDANERVVWVSGVVSG